jgi:hypothetical protein
MRGTMRLIKFSTHRDYGVDRYVQVLFNEYWAFFQGNIGWNDFASWPYINLKSGTGSLLSFTLWVHRLNIELGFIERTWNWDFLKDVIGWDEITTE